MPTPKVPLIQEKDDPGCDGELKLLCAILEQAEEAERRAKLRIGAGIQSTSKSTTLPAPTLAMSSIETVRTEIRAKIEKLQEALRVLDSAEELLRQ